MTKREFEEMIINKGESYEVMKRIDSYLEVFSRFKSKIPPSTEGFSRAGWINNMFKRGGYLSDLYKILHSDWYSMSSGYECFMKLESNLKNNLDYVMLCSDKDSKNIMALKVATESIFEIYNTLMTEK